MIPGTSIFAFVLFCLSVPAALAQIQDLATTDDGSQLYFSSVLQLKGTSQFANGKIFRYANGGFELVAQVTPTVTLGDGSVFHFDFRMPSVTGDGSALAYDGTSTCTGPTYCPGSFTARGFVSGEQLPPDMTNYFGSLRISHNGRYALRFGGTAAGVPPGAPELYDSQFGQSMLVKPCPAVCTIGDGRQSVSDDGSVLTTQGLWRNGQVTGAPVNAVAGRLSPNGATIVYEAVASTYCFGGMFGQCTLANALRVHIVATGTELQLALGPSYNTLGTDPKPYFLPTISNDGLLVLYRAPDPQSGLPQVFLSLSNGGVTRRLTNDPAGISEAVLSGDGHRAYAATQAGGILAIYIDSGQIETVLPSSPFVKQPASPVVPGSLLTLNTPAPADSEIDFGGFSAPVVSTSPTAVTVQVPWEIDVSKPVTVQVDNSASPFEQVLTYQSVAAAPQHLVSVHGDFRGQISYDDPAATDETIVLYMTGLGPVDPPVATGQPAPATPLSYLQFPLQCQWSPAAQTAQLLFAGLAPLSIGVYQVNVRVPPGVATQYGSATLTCALTLPSGGTSSSGGTLVPIRMAQ